MQAHERLSALTEKEKQALRLMVRGHDAKSMARSLELSVHTINERLRDARRKLAVSSSREAARLLLEAEDAGSAEVDRLPQPASPQPLGYTEIGGALQHTEVDQDTAPVIGARRPARLSWILFGVVLMTLALALLALTAAPQGGLAPTPATTSSEASDPQVVGIARQWLALVDQGRWDDSYRETGAAFRKLNSAKVWSSVSQKVRPPLGAVLSRDLLSQQFLPAPPEGYEVVKFRTRFANKDAAVETVTLHQEKGQWRVVAVTIE